MLWIDPTANVRRLEDFCLWILPSGTSLNITPLRVTDTSVSISQLHALSDVTTYIPELRYVVAILTN